MWQYYAKYLADVKTTTFNHWIHSLMCERQHLCNTKFYILLPISLWVSLQIKSCHPRMSKIYGCNWSSTSTLPGQLRPAVIWLFLNSSLGTSCSQSRISHTQFTLGLLAPKIQQSNKCEKHWILILYVKTLCCRNSLSLYSAILYSIFTE